MAIRIPHTRQNLAFSKAAGPIVEPVTKFGGQPVWIDTPSWPISASTGQPMRFIGQVRLPGEEIRIGYLFMTQEDDFIDNTYNPHGGENAFFTQPGKLPEFCHFENLREGPIHGPDHHAVLTTHDPEDQSRKHRSRLWGEPDWLQRASWPTEPGSWSFVLQLDSADEPFDIDFGDAGVAYAFLDQETGEGRFLWQSA